ncbi:sensor histidine kinase [Fodinibius saliphilus]|uniref:sensor histidine kinase n=1 Tax=Fodinibius saliphilus TaxID=1920650 RepID=UPI001109115A|nr:PAS domain S-box protein [Fodinibius saliphilus]
MKNIPNRKILDVIPGFFYILNKERNFIRVNDNFVEELGYTREEIEIMHPLDFHFEEDHERIKKRIQSVFKSGGVKFVDKLKRKNGSHGWYQITSTRFKQNGEYYIMGTGIDISERIEFEQRLKYKNKLQSKLFENAPVGIVTVDSNGNLLDSNNKFEKIFKYKKEEVIGKNIDDLISTCHREEGNKDLIKLKEVDKEGTFEEESIRICKDGTEVEVLVAGIPVVVTNHETIYYILYCDISERVEYMNKLETSLVEKKVLLKEVHHRVKNNLAVVMSLLQLKKFNIDDDHILKTLIECENQILTIAQIHEKLYASNSLISVQMEHYVNDFTKVIKKSYDFTHKIEMNVDCDSFELDINQAIPCALIINEVLSNSFVHAFKSKFKGNVDISVKEIEGKVSISIKDNGAGISAKQLEKKSLGFDIIRQLIKQLEGELSIKNQNGVLVEFLFEKQKIKGSRSAIGGYSTVS